MCVWVFVHILYECLQNEETAQFQYLFLWIGTLFRNYCSFFFIFISTIYIFFKLSTEILI